MPLYEYQCESCGGRFERIQKFADPPVSECPSCSGPVRKLVSSPAFQFKGSGWYITDYARKGEKPASDGADKTATATDKATGGAGGGDTLPKKEGKTDAPTTPSAPAPGKVAPKAD